MSKATIQPEVNMGDSVLFVRTEGNCDVCGKYHEVLHHFGEMCDDCYREWSAGWNPK